MVSIVTEKLLKELYFMCLMSDNVIDNPLASIGVRDTAIKVLRPIIQKTARKAVDVMTEVVQKREISVDVDSLFLVTYTVLGEDIYRLILLKISDDISEDDGIFMIQNYKAVSKLRMLDFKTIFDNISKKSATATDAGGNADTESVTASSSNALTTERPKYGWLSRFFNFKTIPVVSMLLKFSYFLLQASSANRAFGCNLVEGSGGSWMAIREERLCDLVPQAYETKAELARMTSVQETVETPDVTISYSVRQYDREWYTELFERDRPLDASILAFADIDDLFPKNMIMDNDDSTETTHTSGSISLPKETPSTPSAEQHTTEPLDKQQATVMPSTLDKILIDRLSKRQGTPMGSLFANVPDLFSTNELRPAFDEDTSNATSVAPPEESDSSNGLGDFDFASMYESEWKEKIGFSRAPVEQLNSTRLFPINLPDGILENLENENSKQQ